MPLYFAFGANMDKDAMERRCPRSRPLGLARLMRHRLVAMSEGFLTVVRDPRATVHGVLWDLALSDVAALDRFEEVVAGLYKKVLQPVVTANGAKRALVYLGANSGPGRAKAEYIVGVLASAKEWGMPEEGILALEKLAREAGVNTAPQTALTAPKIRPLFATPLERR
jgi:gamma-glutamylcyclotransferase (GGCT)/AIG2-like uncharacterized protein YtfP